MGGKTLVRLWQISLGDLSRFRHFRNSSMKRILKFTIWLFSIVVFLGVCTTAYFWYVWSSNLPYIGSMKEYRPPIITEIYSDDGKFKSVLNS